MAAAECDGFSELDDMDSKLGLLGPHRGLLQVVFSLLGTWPNKTRVEVGFKARDVLEDLSSVCIMQLQ